MKKIATVLLLMSAVSAASAASGPEDCALPCWVRVARSGNEFSVYVSSDGNTWLQLGARSLTIEMGTNAFMGLYVIADSKDKLNAATFDQVSIASGAQSADIGAVGVAGSTSESGGTWTVKGSGGGFWGKTDVGGFRYVYQPASGDCEIKSRVTAMEKPGNNSRVGVMIRETLDTNSCYAAMVMTPKKEGFYQYRAKTGNDVRTIAFKGATTMAADAKWQNISAALSKSLGQDTKEKLGKHDGLMANFKGMLVLPNGTVYASVEKSIHYSADQGATWNRLGENWMGGYAQNWTSFRMYYPDRIGLTMDGPIAVSSDMGKSWVQIVKNTIPLKETSSGTMKTIRVVSGDMDLAVNMPPKTILGMVHHGDLAGGGFVQTSDGGATWDWSPNTLKEMLGGLCTGVINATSFLRGGKPKKDGSEPGIHLSTDLGQTWTKVADYTSISFHPVHYGANIYWIAQEGVVVSRDGGKTWSIYGSPVKNIAFGPYFGKSEQEMMVVSGSEGYFITRDGGTSWTRVAPYFAPFEKDGNQIRGNHRYFGWDSEKNILYTSYFGGNIWKLQLGATPAAK